MRMAPLLAALLSALPAAAAETDYGAKGIFPVYESNREWIVFDKRPPLKGKANPLSKGARFLVVGSVGSELFEVERASGTYGGGCRGRKPLKLRAVTLSGPRRSVGRPIIAIKVPQNFSLKGSRAVYKALKNEVDDAVYERIGGALKNAALEDAKGGRFRFQLDDPGGDAFLADPKIEQIQMKIDYASKVAMSGVQEPLVLVEETQISGSYRRCLRLADGGKLVGDCVEMPRALMVETAGLQFVAYDPSGRGQPFLLAFTPSQPMWGDERWGFVIRPNGPRHFLTDTMDIRCREGF